MLPTNNTEGCSNPKAVLMGAKQGRPGVQGGGTQVKTHSHHSLRTRPIFPPLTPGVRDAIHPRGCLWVCGMADGRWTCTKVLTPSEEIWQYLSSWYLPDCYTLRFQSSNSRNNRKLFLWVDSLVVALAEAQISEVPYSATFEWCLFIFNITVSWMLLPKFKHRVCLINNSKGNLGVQGCQSGRWR